MEKVLSFGELLLRISPDGNGQWLTENKLPFYIGGAEANVAAALALWNVPSAYLSAVPDNYLAKEITDYLSSLNIDTTRMICSGQRLGIYYLSQGNDLKSTGVIYDRENSSFAALKPGKINWSNVFEGIDWFHFSAICPALNQDIANVCTEALKEATTRKIKVSIDLNYRAKLWNYGKEPDQIMPGLVRYCDLVMGNVWAADKMLNIRVPEGLAEQDKKEIYLQQAETTSKTLMGQYPNCKVVANTFRFEHNGGIKYYTTLFTEDKLYISKVYEADKVTNKIGSGDCFMAGLIYGSLKKMGPQEILDFATAAAFAKLFTAGDFSTAGIADINHILEDNE